MDILKPGDVVVWRCDFCGVHQSTVISVVSYFDIENRCYELVVMEQGKTSELFLWHNDFMLSWRTLEC